MRIEIWKDTGFLCRLRLSIENESVFPDPETEQNTQVAEVYASMINAKWMDGGFGYSPSPYQGRLLNIAEQMPPGVDMRVILDQEEEITYEEDDEGAIY